MTHRHALSITSAAALALAALAVSTPAAALDAEAAQALAKKSECTKCHSVDKDKKGPSYKKIAANYKGKADAEEKTIKKMTTTFKVKLSDGSEEDHKVVNTKDAAAIKNLSQWILSQ